MNANRPISIPQTLIDNWETHYATVVYPAISDPTSAYSLTQVLAVTGAAYEPGDPASVLTTTQNLLWYSVFATNDAQEKLGGQPFDNWERVYSGSDDDAALNAGVRRYQADPAALTAIAGDLQKQLAANAGNDTGSLMNADLVPSRFLEDQDQKL